MRFFKTNRFTQVIFILSLTLMLTQCGFKLRDQNNLPPELRNLYVTSCEPYNKFVLLLRQTLKQMKVHLPSSPDQASAHLDIQEAKLTYSEPDVATSNKARTFDLTYTVKVKLENTNGCSMLTKKAETVKVLRSLKMNPGQTLYSNSELDVMKREMEQEALTLLFYRLEAARVQTASQ